MSRNGGVANRTWVVETLVFVLAILVGVPNMIFWLALGGFLHNWVLVAVVIGLTALGALGGRRLGQRFGHGDGLLGAGIGLLLVNGLLFLVGAVGFSVLLGHLFGDP